MSSLRRRHITDPLFQFAFARALVRGFAIAVLGPACLFLTIYIAIARHSAPAIQSTIYSTLSDTLGWFFALTMLLAAATFALGIYISHKFVGPLKRIEGWSARRLLGEPADKPALRPGDELGAIVDGLAKLGAPKDL